MLLTTFLLTVLVDLTVAIEVGMVLAAFLFMRRMAEVTNVSAVTRELDDDGRATTTIRTPSSARTRSRGRARSTRSTDRSSSAPPRSSRRR